MVASLRMNQPLSGVSANDDSGYNCSANDRSAFYRYKTASIDYSRICNRKRISEKSRRLEIQYCRRRFLWPSNVNVNICSSEKIDTFASANISQHTGHWSRRRDATFRLQLLPLQTKKVVVVVVVVVNKDCIQQKHGLQMYLIINNNPLRYSPRRAKTDQPAAGLTATCRSRGGRSSNQNAGFCDGNALAAVEEYRRLFPDRRVTASYVFSRVYRMLSETGKLPSVSLRSEREPTAKLIYSPSYGIQDPKLILSLEDKDLVYLEWRAAEQRLEPVYIRPVGEQQVGLRDNEWSIPGMQNCATIVADITSRNTKLISSFHSTRHWTCRLKPDESFVIVRNCMFIVGGHSTGGLLKLLTPSTGLRGM
ncbi:hypothetical protein ANN_01629 [Periplaneta americana]|uniref:DUF4817 domain-containing protein n=1 Tax=Periplaneta americana TaxID=6978 RepID=A0ABQ8TU38_PERAM|nr:hypothetical protein ANN_01629 [Periplaneta americana]